MRSLIDETGKKQLIRDSSALSPGILVEFELKLGQTQSETISGALRCDILYRQPSSRQHVEWCLRGGEGIDGTVRNEACAMTP
jgi:hypothetical protein